MEMFSIDRSRELLEEYKPCKRSFKNAFWIALFEKQYIYSITKVYNSFPVQKSLPPKIFKCSFKSKLLLGTVL